MPLADFNAAAFWNGGATSLYRAVIGGTTYGYVRAAKDQFSSAIGIDAMAAALASKGLVKGQRIVIIGAAFGWASERLVATGYGPICNSTPAGRICNVDISTWIHANNAANATVTVVNEDVSKTQGRNAIKAQFGNVIALEADPETGAEPDPQAVATIDWVVSEDVLPILSNNESTALNNSMKLLGTNVAHVISCGVRQFDNPNVWAGDSRLNWKTLEDWKTLMGTVTVMGRNEGGRLL
jgi:hypothetical protein